MSFLEWITNINNSVNGFVWGWVGLILLLGTGVLATVVTKVFQISHLKHWWNNTIGSLFKKEVIGHTKEKGAISPFQALCTALAATVGTGNISGVAAAICVGGAGAVFWMWVAAFLGMMTNYSENVLGIYFRRKNEKGEWSGGAMYYLRDGLGAKKNCKWIGKVLAVLFCIFTMLASFGIGSMGQVNKIVANVAAAFDVSALSSIKVFSGVSLYNIILGAVIMVLVALITLGGLKRIAAVAEKIIPFMVVLFVAGSIVVIGFNYANILPALKAIFVNAFKPEAFVGGTLGSAIMLAAQQGFKRGVFSNEAGLGTSAMAHSVAVDADPKAQGLYGIFEVFVDTILLCTLTGLTILCSGVKINYGTSASTELISNALNIRMGNFGNICLSIMMCLFAFSSIVGWALYGRIIVKSIFGDFGVKIFTFIYPLCCILGAVLGSNIVWRLAALCNGIMLCTNLTAVLLLTQKFKPYLKKEKKIEN